MTGSTAHARPLLPTQHNSDRTVGQAPQRISRARASTGTTLTTGKATVHLSTADSLTTPEIYKINLYYTN